MKDLCQSVISHSKIEGRGMDSKVVNRLISYGIYDLPDLKTLDIERFASWRNVGSVTCGVVLAMRDEYMREEFHDFAMLSLNLH